MIETQEFYAATVDEAVLRAAAALSIAPEQLSYEVVDAGGAGFLGIGARDARIAVHVGNTRDAKIEITPEQHSEPAPLEPDVPVPAEAQPQSIGAADSESTVPEELLEDIRGLVTAIIDAMGISARIDVYESNDEIAVDVTSEETGLFIGQKGETIDSLQYLVNVAAYRDRPFSKRIVLDSEGYRQRRIEAIQGIAHRTARKAIREKKSFELPPMSAAERRIVHVYLKENPQVNTASEGTGLERRVTIFPVR